MDDLAKADARTGSRLKDAVNYLKDNDAVPTVIVGPESWNRLWPDCRQLMLDHKDELGQNDPRAPLDPDHYRIQLTAESGGLLILGARHGRELVGYSIWYLLPSLETVGLVMAMQAPWYVKPEFRSLGVGVRLWNLAMLQLRQRGVQLVMGHVPAEGPGQELIHFVKRKGGKVIGTEFALWLTEPLEAP